MSYHNDPYRVDYLKIYPCLKERPDVLEVLKKSDRKMKYMEVDLKSEQRRKNAENGAESYVPSKEDSLERLVYAILTDEISRAWSGMSTRQYKNLKGLKKENLRDNMTTLELVLNMLAEATTTQFSRDRKPTTFQENLAVAKAGGQVAGRTRKDIESQSDTPVITAKNAAQLNQVVTDLLEGAVSDTTEESKDK